MRFSVRSTTGRWGPWLDAAAEEEDQPDAGPPRPPRPGAGGSATRPGSGPANGIRYAITGRVTDLRATFVRSPELKIPLRARRGRRAHRRSCPAAPGGRTSRSAAASPTYAPAIRFASVHHTAGTNDYSPSQAAAIMRGIQIYHVKSNGWNDIGYNFLVDRYGTVYEGRYGGIDRNVVGAHIRGFNTGAVGVAVIGTFGTSRDPGRRRVVAREAPRLAARPRPRRSRSRRSRSSRAAASAIPPACRSCCARSRGTATPA